MKKLLFMLALCLPALLGMAKEKKDNSDPKYLSGAITLVDGKVTFEKELKTPELKKKELFDLMKTWADGRFKPDDKLNGRVVYADEEKGDIAAAGEEYIVFSSSALSLDRTRIYYQLTIHVEDGGCSIVMTRIRYWYDEARDGGERYDAEEWITDDMALNKKKTKLAPICGKFRRETINLKDAIFASASAALGQHLLETNKAVAETPTVAVVPQTVTLGSSDVLKEVNVDKLPVNLSEIAAKGRITLTAANGEETELQNESWAGLGKLFNKNVAYLLIDQSRIAASAMMEQSETYKISFYTGGETRPVVTIACKKMMKQSMKAEDLKAMNLKTDEGKQYVMYTGEVTGAQMR